jgi:hypothetical protein
MRPMAGRRIPELTFALARPVALGEEILQLLQPASWNLDDGPLRAGQFLGIGGELRIVLQVGEHWVRFAPLEDDHPTTDDIVRREQVEQDIGWYWLTG